MGLVEHILVAPSVTDTQQKNAVQRILSGPGIPESRYSTAPFWLEDPHPTIAKAQSAALPVDVDIVIIGSGITAASIARYIFKTKGSAAPNIAILEARDICSGATGRNGGHINEGIVHSYSEHVETFGRESAKKIARFRLGHLPLILKAAEEDGLMEDSQVRALTANFAFFEEEGFATAKVNLHQFKTDMPDESASFEVFEGRDAREVSAGMIVIEQL